MSHKNSRFDYGRRRFLQKAGMATGAMAGLSFTGFTGSTVPVFPRILPQRLSKGDTIALIAPGGAVFNEKDITVAEEEIRRAGFQTVRSPNILKQYGQFAGTDQERAADVAWAFQKTEVKAVVAMRGGSGCARITHLLDYQEMVANPKIFMGFSDITTLLHAIWLNTGMYTFHGPVGYSTWNTFSMEQLGNVLISAGTSISLQSQILLNKDNAESVRGRVFGGNLRVFTHLLGTPLEPTDTDMILMIEEVEEEPYSIDRALTHIRQWRNFHKVRAVVFGGFSKCVPEEPTRSLTLEQVLTNFAEDAGVPVLWNAAFGHIRDKVTFPIGAVTTIDLANGKLILDEPCVS
jgi:muramoyltetrapeptide carboxypeptidase